MHASSSTPYSFIIFDKICSSCVLLWCFLLDASSSVCISIIWTASFGGLCRYHAHGIASSILILLIMMELLFVHLRLTVPPNDFLHYHASAPINIIDVRSHCTCCTRAAPMRRRASATSCLFTSIAAILASQCSRCQCLLRAGACQRFIIFAWIVILLMWLLLLNNMFAVFSWMLWSVTARGWYRRRGDHVILHWKMMTINLTAIHLLGDLSEAKFAAISCLSFLIVTIKQVLNIAANLVLRWRVLLWIVLRAAVRHHVHVLIEHALLAWLRCRMISLTWDASMRLAATSRGASTADSASRGFDTLTLAIVQSGRSRN